MPNVRKYANAAEKQAAYRRRCSSRDREQTHSPPAPSLKRWKAMMTQAICILETAAGEMQLYHDQRSQRWQDSERGEQFRDMMESLEEVTAALTDI